MLGLANAVKLLIAHGANVNGHDISANSPLHWAAAKGDLFYFSYSFFFNTIKGKKYFFFSVQIFYKKKVMRMLQRYWLIMVLMWISQIFFLDCLLIWLQLWVHLFDGVFQTAKMIWNFQFIQFCFMSHAFCFLSTFDF